ncbi:MAG: adenylate/guanylate cyclase domain-containing protein [Magnetococcales bacterium]|nr:adenylate/guanylate cyclase domain-containing protein [Magnetococcales bacterium]
MNRLTLAHVDLKKRLWLHGLTGLAVVFLTFYGKVVCPFIDTLTVVRVAAGLGVVWIFQIFVREWLYRWLPRRFPNTHPARQGFHGSVIAWLLSGIAASILHGTLYPGFHWASHLKLLSGYWGLGAGILSQLEYVILENHFRTLEKRGIPLGMERIARRLMEGFFLFTLVPAMMMVLMSFRFVYEGYTHRAAAFEVLFLGTIFVLAGLSVSWLYGRALRKDCDHLLQVVEDVSMGHFQVEVDLTRGDELGRVAAGIQEMAQGLAQRERIREAFGRFVNPEVAESFIKNYAQTGLEGAVKLGGKRQQVAILMADIRHFTPLSETMPPEALTGLLNSYFLEMVAAIQAHGGMVDKFIGDAVMAVFGLTPGREDFPGDAVAAALEMRQRLEQFNWGRHNLGEAPIENGIGIHLGEVVAGYIGSPDRLEFTIIGHSVNLAARIEGRSKPPNPPILFSQAMADHLGDRFTLREVETTQLKGITGTTTLYTVEV